jgi:hypothetical protein
MTKKLMNHIERRAQKENREKTDESKNLADQHRPNMPTKVDVEHHISDQQRQRKLS